MCGLGCVHGMCMARGSACAWLKGMCGWGGIHVWLGEGTGLCIIWEHAWLGERGAGGAGGACMAGGPPVRLTNGRYASY